jgi:uncharacterized membrane protein
VNDSSTGLSTRAAALLAYIGWWATGLILWFLERRDREARFHAAQAIVAFGGLTLVVALLAGLALISLSFFPGAFEWLIGAAEAVAVGAMVLWGMTVWGVASGRDWRLPIAAPWAERLARAWAPAGS